MLKTVERSPIKVITKLSKNVFNAAGRIKSTYHIPMGDTIAAAECIIGNGTLVTSDHKDFEKVERSENIKVLWFR
jgi:predicted nucleic acid-binding protein